MKAGGLAQPVAQLNRRQGIEAKVLEGVPWLDLRWGGMAEDHRRLGAHEVLGKARTRPLRCLPQALHQRSLARARRPDPRGDRSED